MRDASEPSSSPLRTALLFGGGYAAIVLFGGLESMTSWQPRGEPWSFQVANALCGGLLVAIGTLCFHIVHRRIAHLPLSRPLAAVIGGGVAGIAAALIVALRTEAPAATGAVRLVGLSVVAGSALGLTVLFAVWIWRMAAKRPRRESPSAA